MKIIITQDNTTIVAENIVEVRAMFIDISDNTLHDYVVSINVCKCGFRFENIDKAIALCEQAELSIERLDFDITKVHLDDAAGYWNECNKIPTLKRALEERKNRVGIEVTKMHEAIKLKKYCEAKKQYQTIKKLYSSYSDAEIETQIEQAIDNAKKLFNQAKAAKDEKKILELCALA